MYGLTRGAITLIGAAAAGFLIWLSVQIDGTTLGDYWSVVGVLAAAGLVVALSQLLGGWTKWGWPRLSGSVFVLAFLPVFVAVGWILLAYQPDSNWLSRHVASWSKDLHLVGIMSDLARSLNVLAFGLGLVFGLVFDTTGPRTEPLFRRRDRPAAALPGAHPLESAPPPPASERSEPPGAVANVDEPPADERRDS